MPSHAPRTDTTKKREQLTRREQELQHAIRCAVPREQLVRAAEAVRAAHLSLLKAEHYWAEDASVLGRDVDARIDKIRNETQKWSERLIDEILDDYTMASYEGSSGKS